MTRRWTPQTRYTLRRNTASIMKGLVWIHPIHFSEWSFLQKQYFRNDFLDKLGAFHKSRPHKITKNWLPLVRKCLHWLNSPYPCGHHKLYVPKSCESASEEPPLSALDNPPLPSDCGRLLWQPLPIAWMVTLTNFRLSCWNCHDVMLCNRHLIILSNKKATTKRNLFYWQLCLIPKII